METDTSKWTREEWEKYTGHSMNGNCMQNIPMFCRGCMPYICTRCHAHEFDRTRCPECTPCPTCKPIEYPGWEKQAAKDRSNRLVEA